MLFCEVVAAFAVRLRGAPSAGRSETRVATQSSKQRILFFMTVFLVDFGKVRRSFHLLADMHSLADRNGNVSTSLHTLPHLYYRNVK